MVISLLIVTFKLLILSWGWVIKVL